MFNKAGLRSYKVMAYDSLFWLNQFSNTPSLGSPLRSIDPWGEGGGPTTCQMRVQYLSGEWAGLKMTELWCTKSFSLRSGRIKGRGWGWKKRIRDQLLFFFPWILFVWPSIHPLWRSMCSASWVSIKNHFLVCKRPKLKHMYTCGLSRRGGSAYSRGGAYFKFRLIREAPGAHHQGRLFKGRR